MSEKISIHAPLVGRDMRFVCDACQDITFQSTRPLWGATMLRTIFLGGSQYFNPRAPCGARPEKRAINAMSVVFQSTRPLWGAT